MDGLRPCCFEGAALAAQWGTTTRAQKKRQQGTQGKKTNNQQPGRQSIAGLRPDSRTKRGNCRAWLIDDRGKAWSKRPDRQAGRHGRKRPPLRGAKTGTNHARPTSRPPAQPGACARHAGKVCGDRKTEKPVYQERGGQLLALNGLQRRAEAARHAFRGLGIVKGQAGPESGLYGPLVKSAGFETLNLSCEIEKSSGFQRNRRFDAPHHSPPPLASEGSESPSVVRDAGGGALRFLDCTPD